MKRLDKKPSRGKGRSPRGAAPGDAKDTKDTESAEDRAERADRFFGRSEHRPPDDAPLKGGPSGDDSRFGRKI